MRLGYLIPEFPGQTHIFFWREVLTLRAMGVEVVMISTRQPPLDSCRAITPMRRTFVSRSRFEKLRCPPSSWRNLSPSSTCTRRPRDRSA